MLNYTSAAEASSTHGMSRLCTITSGIDTAPTERAKEKKHILALTVPSPKNAATEKINLPVFFIYLVSEAHGVDNSELEAHIALLEFIGVGLERDSWLVVLGGLTLKLGVEQRVH